MLNATCTKNWLRYWRNSLADAESCKGVLTKKDIRGFLQRDVSVFQLGRVDHSSFTQALFNGVPLKTQVIKVFIRPTIYFSKYEHSKKHSSHPTIISPIICPVWVSRKGYFYPAGNPTVPRDLLAPQIDDKFTIFSVTELDRFHTGNEAEILSEQEVLALVTSKKKGIGHYSEWENYYSLVRELFSVVYQGEVKRRIETGYQSDERRQVYFIKVDDAMNAAKNILGMYDWLYMNASSYPLLDSYISQQVKSYETCIPFTKTIHQRLGYSNSQFSLSDAQRDALSHVMVMRDGEILAVNGPPGTGKTTFILSVVASLWVKAALEEIDPPIVMAVSTNNQAVTNVIDSFSKNFEENNSTFSGRWLPEIESYGGYFPAASKEDELEDQYQTKAFYESLEQSEYLDKAEDFFKEKARIALNLASGNSLSIETIKISLLAEMKVCHVLLKKYASSWEALEAVRKECLEKINGDPFVNLEKSRAQIDYDEQLLKFVSDDKKLWQQFLLKESIWLLLFSWLPPVRRKLQLLRTVFIANNFNVFTKSLIKNERDITRVLDLWLDQQRNLLGQHRRNHSSLKNLVERLSKMQNNWKNVVGQVIAFTKELPTIDEVDKKLDCVFRFKLFQLAVHYWEAQWLLSCRKLESNGKDDWAGHKKTGLKSVLPRWRRRMMLTPCIVSTLHALPFHMTFQTYLGEADYRVNYLVNEIDLLIIDEAGQVSPEVAAASFALGKKALVIGDIHQIEPVRSLTRSIDIGNLTCYGVIKDKSFYEALCETGATVTEGSVMRIAQRASKYHYLSKAEPGMYLREHRRCYDEIISFSNDLCYQGLLIPKRGRAKSDSLFPPMAYLHIDGCAEITSTGSRRNPLEANVIAMWLAENRDSIESYYQKQDKELSNKSLESLVAVVTPFKAQQTLIEKACKKQGIEIGKNEGEMTIGTVHALQGAERPLIIFSPVYSRHSDGNFIDSFPSMLNVAVSRAKDSFLVFGDMDVISSAARGKPRFLLSQFLLKSDSSELVFSQDKRPDLLITCGEPKLINDAEEHDAFISNLLQSTHSNVDMVSPWVSLSRLKETRIFQEMVYASERGVEVNFYTDHYFNTTTANAYDEVKDKRFRRCCEQLSAEGISVYVVEGVHSKLVMADKQFMCVGSYNWASAVRTGKHAYMETSMLYSGDLSKEISLQIRALKDRIRKSYVKEATITLDSSFIAT